MKEFLTTPYIGSDGKDFAKDFAEYLQEILDKGRWESMSEYTLYLQGAKKAIEEVIESIK